jgi:hypothetical protein
MKTVRVIVAASLTAVAFGCTNKTETTTTTTKLKADQILLKQQQAAMERVYRESMERMERQRTENERRARETQEPQEARMR